MRPPKITPGTFAYVIRQYMHSPKFDGLSANTRGAYARYLRIAEHPDSLGSVPVEQMRPALVQAFLDGLADRPSVQGVARTAIKAVEKWAIVRDLLPGPITLGTEVLKRDGGHTPWTDEQVSFAELHAAPHLARVITLAANTGQRGSDLVKMRWTDIEEVEGRPGINVTQVKTGLKLWVPFTSILQAAVAKWRPELSLGGVKSRRAKTDLLDPALLDPSGRLQLRATSEQWMNLAGAPPGPSDQPYGAPQRVPPGTGTVRLPTFILLKEDGNPFTREQLSNQWLRERDTNLALAPLRSESLVLHGLRGTAVVRLRRAGATVPQISDMVGMSPPMVTRYCRYSVQRENALAAVYRLDRTAIERAAELRRKKDNGHKS